MDHGFINIVCTILYDYSGAFIGFVDDYVCIFAEGEIGLDSRIDCLVQSSYVRVHSQSEGI